MISAYELFVSHYIAVLGTSNEFDIVQWLAPPGLSLTSNTPTGRTRFLPWPELQLIDIARGRIKAYLGDYKGVNAVCPAPDGRAIYSSVQSCCYSRS